MVAKAVADSAWIPIESPILWDKNPRKNVVAIPRVADSIRRFGFVAPIIIWSSKRRVVAGHTRILALQALLKDDPAFVPRNAPGPGLVRVVYHDFRSEDEANAYAIADNKLNELADWDDLALREILQDMRSRSDVDLLDTGFAQRELDRLLSEERENNPLEEWVGMPECVSEDLTKWGSVLVNFASETDMVAFAKLIGQTVTPSTKSVWYPAAEIGRYADKAYVHHDEDEDTDAGESS
jgi:hypothetical protein